MEDKHLKIERTVQTLGRVEFFTEQIFQYVVKTGDIQQQLLKVLLVFESAKLPLNLYKHFQYNNNQIQISEENMAQREHDLALQKAHFFNQKFSSDDWKYIKKQEQQKQDENVINNSELQQSIESTTAEISSSNNSVQNSSVAITEERKQLLEKLKFSLDSIKNQSLLTGEHNRQYQQTFSLTKKMYGIINSLPIPLELFQNAKQINTSKNVSTTLSEFIHMTRPVVYCFLMIIYGIKSYKPYFFSLGLDLLRMFLTRKFKPTKMSEAEEMVNRNRQMVLCYLLRNPFYSEVLKIKVIQPLIEKILPKKLQFIGTFLLSIIEMRCSLSLLM